MTPGLAETGTFGLTEEPPPTDPADAAAWYAAHAEELRRFLWGVLRDHALVQDVLQATYVKTVEKGHTSREGSRKGWLFRVAYNEALAIRRREAVGDRAVRQLARQQADAVAAADEPLVRGETVERVQQAIAQLPEQQQQVVRMRIYEEKTFAAIAQQLGIPLGTALGRMRTALAKLKQQLRDRT